MHNCISSTRLKLLKDREFGEGYLSDFKTYLKLRPEIKAEFIAPYVQTQSFINEAVSLERIPHDRYVKLKEPNGGRKDRYSSIGYGNFFISTLEREKIKKDARVRKDLMEYTFFD